MEPIVSTPKRGRSRAGPGGRVSGGPSRGYVVAVGAVCLLIVVLLVALLSGGGSSNHASTTASTTHARHGVHRHAGAGQTAGASSVVALSLRPTAPVYVCLIGEGGRTLIPGRELQPGADTATFHARRFEVTLGNASVVMIIDGRGRTVPPSSEAIGYEITKANGRRPLPAGSLPTCR